MLTTDQAQRIASIVLSSPVVQMMTIVPHDEGKLEHDGRSYPWNALHLPQAQIFLIVRRTAPKGSIEFVSFNSVIDLVRATSDLKSKGAASLTWRALD